MGGVETDREGRREWEDVDQKAGNVGLEETGGRTLAGVGGGEQRQGQQGKDRKGVLLQVRTRAGASEGEQSGHGEAAQQEVKGENRNASEDGRDRTEVVGGRRCALRLRRPDKSHREPEPRGRRCDLSRPDTRLLDALRQVFQEHQRKQNHPDLLGERQKQQGEGNRPWRSTFYGDEGQKEQGQGEGLDEERVLENRAGRRRRHDRDHREQGSAECRPESPQVDEQKTARKRQSGLSRPIESGHDQSRRGHRADKGGQEDPVAPWIDGEDPRFLGHGDVDVGIEAGEIEAVPDDARIEVGSMVILRETRADETGDDEGRGVLEVSSAQPRAPWKARQCPTVRFLRRKSMSTASPRS